MKPGTWGLKLPEPSCHLKLNFLICFSRFITPGWEAVNWPSFRVNLPEGKDVSWKGGKQMSSTGRGFQEHRVWQGSRERWEGAAKGTDKPLQEYVPKDFSLWLVSSIEATSSKQQVNTFLTFSYKMKSRGKWPSVEIMISQIPKLVHSSSDRLTVITAFNTSVTYLRNFLPTSTFTFNFFLFLHVLIL